MGFTTTMANNIINKILRNTDFTSPTNIYFSLHTADSSESGANEVTGGSYARQLINFTTASSKTSMNSGIVSFVNMPATTVTHVGLWDAVSGGTFIWSGVMSFDAIVLNGATLGIAIGDFDVSLI